MKTVKTTYDKMCDEVDEILKLRGAEEIYLRFSIFESLDEDEDVIASEDWLIEVVDFNEEFAPGKVVFETDYYASEIYENPTWKDAVFEANESILGGMVTCHLDGWDHVFLESIKPAVEMGGVKYYRMWFGS